MEESDLYSRFGQLVRQHRERLGLNQAEIGKAIRLSRASIANIETGRQRIPIHHLYRLARALKVDVHALLPTVQRERSATVDREIRSAVELSKREQEEAYSLGVPSRGFRCHDYLVQLISRLLPGISGRSLVKSAVGRIVRAQHDSHQ